MNQFCPNNINPCSDPDDPRGNFSSAEPDKEIFIARAYSVQQQPPLGPVWYASSCVGRVRSTISQEDANLKAQQANLQCLADEWPELEPNPSNDPNQPPYIPVTRRTYLNEEQTADYTCADGSVFTYTVPAGTFTAFSQEAANAQAASYATNQSIAKRICIGELEVNSVCLGDYYDQEVSFDIGNPPAQVAIIAGALPPGLTLNFTGGIFADTFSIMGTVAGVGTHTFTVRVNDLEGNYQDKTFTILVATIANTSLANSSNGIPYSEILYYSGSVNGSVRWTVVSGALPTGLTLNTTTGEISGTPTVDGDYTFTVQMEDGF